MLKWFFLTGGLAVGYYVGCWRGETVMCNRFVNRLIDYLKAKGCRNQEIKQKIYEMLKIDESK